MTENEIGRLYSSFPEYTEFTWYKDAQHRLVYWQLVALSEGVYRG